VRAQAEPSIAMNGSRECEIRMNLQADISDDERQHLDDRSDCRMPHARDLRNNILASDRNLHHALR
jgi:hypothetical protein